MTTSSGNEITCHHCGHKWKPRKKEPKKCPQCQNPRWKSDKPKRKRAVHLSELAYYPDPEKLLEHATSIEASVTAAEVPQETATSTPEVQNDASGAEGSETVMIEYSTPNGGEDGFFAKAYAEAVKAPPDPIQEAKAKAEELLRRLNAPSD